MTLRGHVALGDSPEYVAGVDSLGILHAPGYPAYVIVGRVFTWLLPVGELALRVNLFSAAATAATAVAGTFAISRRLGASAPASAIAALALATGTSFWFYAGYAKHYAFAAMLLALTSALVLAWRDEGGRWRLLAAGALLGLMGGSSWQLGLLAVPVLAVVIWLAPRPVPVRDLGWALLTGALVVVLLYGFVVVRAGQDPALNWDNADSLSGLVRLVTMGDFGHGTQAIVGGDGARTVGSEQVAQLPERFRRYGVMFSRELGIAVLALAVLGLGVAWRSLRATVAPWYLTTAFVVNTLAAALVVGPTQLRGFSTNLVLGGFMVGIFMPICLAAAIGIDTLSREVGRRVGWKGAGAVATGVLAVVVVVPSLVVHHQQLERRNVRYADAYATDVLDAGPPDAVVVVMLAERTFPLLYRQVVHGDRPDVHVVAAEGLTFDWYREQTERRLGIELPGLDRGDPPADAAQVIATIEQHRPVRLDLFAASEFDVVLGYVVEGLVARPVPGEAGTRAPDDIGALEEVADELVRPELRRDRYRTTWPNRLVNNSYLRLHLELAILHAAQGNLDDAERHLHVAASIDPDHELVQENLAILEEHRSRRAAGGG